MVWGWSAFAFFYGCSCLASGRDKPCCSLRAIRHLFCNLLNLLLLQRRIKKRRQKRSLQGQPLHRRLPWKKVHRSRPPRSLILQNHLIFVYRWPPSRTRQGQKDRCRHGAAGVMMLFCSLPMTRTTPSGGFLSVNLKTSKKPMPWPPGWKARKTPKPLSPCCPPRKSGFLDPVRSMA